MERRSTFKLIAGGFLLPLVTLLPKARASSKVTYRKGYQTYSTAVPKGLMVLKLTQYRGNLVAITKAGAFYHEVRAGRWVPINL